MYIFASDFDNTLYFKGEIHSEDCRAIQSFQKQGHLFGICTGRPKGGILPNIEGFVNLDFLISSTGANVELHEQVQHLFSGEQALVLYDALGELPNKFLHTATGDLAYVDYAPSHGFPGIVVLSKRDAQQRDFLGLSFSLNTELEAKEYTDLINTKYQDWFLAHQNKKSVDTVKAGISKGTGIEEIRKKYPEAIIVGIGDAKNDLPLLEAVDISFTFHSSEKSLQEKVDYVVDSIAQAISILEEKKD